MWSTVLGLILQLLAARLGCVTGEYYHHILALIPILTVTENVTSINGSLLLLDFNITSSYHRHKSFGF
jgi:hypothetical protein